MERQMKRVFFGETSFVIGSVAEMFGGAIVGFSGLFPVMQHFCMGRVSILFLYYPS